MSCWKSSGENSKTFVVAYLPLVAMSPKCCRLRYAASLAHGINALHGNRWVHQRVRPNGEAAFPGLIVDNDVTMAALGASACPVDNFFSFTGLSPTAVKSIGLFLSVLQSSPSSRLHLLMSITREGGRWADHDHLRASGGGMLLIFPDE